MKTRAAKTFTSIYDYKEDRIRFVLNYQDPIDRADFWVTRNFLLRLLPLLSKFGRSKEEATLIGGTDGSPSNKDPNASSLKTDETMLALTQKEPVLLERVDIGRGEGGAVHIVFRSTLDNYMASIDPREVDALSNLLIQSAPTYDWGIGPWWGTS